MFANDISLFPTVHDVNLLNANDDLIKISKWALQ